MRLSLLSFLAAAALGARAAQVDQAPLVQSSSSSSPPPYRDALLALHRSLIEHASPSGAEGDVAVWLLDYLAARGYATARMPLPPRANTPPGRPRVNVVAWPAAAAAAAADADGGAGDGPGGIPTAPLLVTSHIDVVPPHIPYAIDNATGPATRATVVRGRGSVDAKAAVAAQITAVEALRAAGALGAEGGRWAGHPAVVLLFVVGEEDSGDGMRAFSERMHAQGRQNWFDAVLFGEPTQNRLACGHKGILNCALAATGRAGHSGYPALGRSATALLVRGLAAVLDADLGASPRFGNTTVNVGRIAGGVAANVIAADARADLAVRVALGPQASGHLAVRARIEAAVAAAAAAAGAPADALRVACPQGYGVVECACAVPGFATTTVNYGTDVPNLAGNHTRYLYGPGDILVAHSDHEAIAVGALETAVEDYARLIRHVLAGGAAEAADSDHA